MKYILSDNHLHLRFAPFTLTRPLGTIRIGIMTNEERLQRWDKEAVIRFQTESYLSPKFENVEEVTDEIVINSQVILDENLMKVISELKIGELLRQDTVWIAKRGIQPKREIFIEGDVLVLEQRWDIFQKNNQALQSDFQWITKGRNSQSLSSSNRVIGDENLVFLEEGAKAEATILNTSDGPIYIGRDAEIMEGSVVRGGLALCEHAVLKLSSKVYGATTLGPYCKTGGELSNVVFQAYSNKGHDGFLGNAVIGEWCNLGADTNASNLKNNYSTVACYSYEKQEIEKTSMQFLGLMMGDHSKCGINTMFNTGTVCGVSSNVFGADFPPKFIPSFAWGGAEGFEKYHLEKAIETAKAMMARRYIEFTDGDRKIFEYILSKNY